MKGYYGLLPERELHSYLMKSGQRNLLSSDEVIPNVLDLGSSLPPNMFQGPLGTCTAHAVSAAFRHALHSSDAPDVAISRLELYYETRVAQGTYPADSGTYIQKMVESLRTNGAVSEEEWPYDISKWNDQPPPGNQLQALSVRPVGVTSLDIRACLWTGKPVIVGLEIFPEFEGDEARHTGVIAMPNRRSPIAAHAMLVWGFNQIPGHFSVQNWWDNWGGSYYGKTSQAFFPEEYFELHGTDFWAIETVTGQYS